jgi:hypothetical protein
VYFGIMSREIGRGLDIYPWVYEHAIVLDPAIFHC